MTENEAEARLIVTLFEELCEQMHVLLSQRHDSRSETMGYYKLTTWIDALREATKQYDDMELIEGEDFRYAELAFPCVEFVTMEQHRLAAAEAVREMSDTDPMFLKMYRGDVFLTNLIETTYDHAKENENVEPVVALFHLMAEPVPKDNSEEYRMDDLISFFIHAPDEAMKAICVSPTAVEASSDEAVKSSPVSLTADKASPDEAMKASPVSPTENEASSDEAMKVILVSPTAVEASSDE